MNAGTEQGPFTRKDLFAAIGLFLVALIVYVRTLAPDVLWGDGAEFQVIAPTNGLAHATGYPIYLTIGKLFSLIPISSLAYRINFLSAFMGAVAVAELYLIIVALRVRRAFALLGATLFLINPYFWWQAIMAEVYTTREAFLFGFLLCAMCWAITRNKKLLFIGGLLGGLCFGIHFLAFLALPFVIGYLWLNKAKRPDWTMAASGAVLGLALACIAFWIRAQPDLHTSQTYVVRPSIGAYGMGPNDLDSPLQRIRFLISAREFSQGLFEDSNNVAKAAGWFGRATLDFFGWLLIGIGAFGAVATLALKRRRREAILLVGSAALIIVFALTYATDDVAVDFLPVFAILGIFVAAAFQLAQEAIAAKRPLTLAGYSSLAAAAVACVIVGDFITVSNGWTSFTSGRPTFLKGEENAYPYPIMEPTRPHDLGKSIIGRIPDGALLVTKWQNVFACYYVAQFEDGKPNIDIVEHLSYSKTGVMAPSLITFLDENVKRRPVFITGVPQSIRDRYFYQPVPGRFPLYQVYPRAN